MTWNEEREKIISRIFDRMDKKGRLRKEIVDGASAKGILSLKKATEMTATLESRANMKKLGKG